jgi:hypothetical protein
MKRIYLDQLHWIALARLATGKDINAKRAEALTLILYAVERGLASFPLSDSHYFETLRRGDPRSRQELGSAMYQISRGHTMAGINELLRPEAAIVLARWHNLPEPPQPRVFGVGMKHAFGLGHYSYFSSPEAERQAVLRHGQEVVDQRFEEALIMGPPERLPSGEIQPPSIEWSQRQLDGERAITARVSAHGHSPNLGRDIVMVEEGTHAVNVVNQIALEQGLRPVEPMSRADVETIVYGMPSKAALTRMRMSAHENEHFKWEIGDLGDLTALAAAAAYCDIVVTERKWGSILRRHHQTLRAKVLTRLEDLPAAMVVAD